MFNRLLRHEPLEDRSLLSVAPVLPLSIALISDAVVQAEQIQQAAAKDTIAIVYDADTMTTSGLVDLVKSVSAAHGGALIEHLGIVTHGGPGEIDIGSVDNLSLATLPSQAAELQQLRSVFTTDARVDLWSCSVAAGPQGKSFVNELAADTGAAVFASDDPVGTVPGADFVWEYHKGQPSTSGDLFSLQELQTIPTVALGTLTVGSPNGGENWQVGTAYNVTWTSTGDTSTWNYQNVALSTDGGANYTNIGTGLAASARSLSFTPTSSQASTSAMIRVRAMDSGAWIQAEDTSNSTFTIKAAAGTLTVGSPNGGENWQVGTAYNVTWTSTGDTSTWNYQNVALSTDGGVTTPTLAPAWRRRPGR